MIDIKDLSFRYERNNLFTDLSLELAPGNIYGLLGVNGAGKSTLLKLMTGLLFANSGTVRTLAHDPAAREPSLLNQIFVLPEELNVPSISEREYVASRAPLYPRFDSALFERYAREFAFPRGVNLRSLSHGERKKFALSFGLACKSAVLLLDEPTNGLDIPSKSQFRRVIAEAASDDRTLVISTHQVRDVGALLDPIVLLHQGRVVLNSSLAEIGSRIRMTHSTSPPDATAPDLLYSEPAIGGFWSVWRDSTSGEGSLDLEVLFNALISRPELCNLLYPAAGGRA
jgi:ABC-2 type transport system ATP-binding protein